MLHINKRLTIKFKLAISVFEVINKAAYATLSRSLGATGKPVHSMLAHNSFCDSVLPIIIGNNNKNSDWEREKYEYVSSIQISIPSTGLNLDLGYTFNRDNMNLKEDILKYIEDYSQFEMVNQPIISTKKVQDLKDATKQIDKEVSTDNIVKVEFEDKQIVSHILDNAAIGIIDYHKYFKFDSPKDYMYWVLCSLSSEVANTPEDVQKSPNIRFFLYDEKVSRKTDMDIAKLEIKAINKLNAIRQMSDGDEIIKNIAIISNAVSFDELQDYEDDSEGLYLRLFTYSKEHSLEFLEIAENKDIAIQSKIKSYINADVLRIDDKSNIIETANTSNILGKDLNDAISYFKNPTNKAEITKFDNRFKSLR